MPVITEHLEVHGTTQFQAERYERFVAGAQRFLQFEVSPLRIHQGVVPRCHGRYCVEDGVMNVYCDDLRRECMPALATAIVDQASKQSLPLLFRDGLVDVLAGGFGHGDVLDAIIDRSRTDELIRLTNDASFESAREAAEAAPFGELAWRAGTIQPAADFVRFVLDELGGRGGLVALDHESPTRDSWGDLGGFESALEAWRISPPTAGRMYRLPIVECDPAYRVPVGASDLPVMVQGVIFAPDLLESISRFGVASFTVEKPSEVTIAVTSSVDGSPFVRVESCGSHDPGPFLNMSDNIVNNTVSMTSGLEPETYFLVAGSWTGASYALAERPERVVIEMRPLE